MDDFAHVNEPMAEQLPDNPMLSCEEAMNILRAFGDWLECETLAAIMVEGPEANALLHVCEGWSRILASRGAGPI